MTEVLSVEVLFLLYGRSFNPGIILYRSEALDVHTY